MQKERHFDAADRLQYWLDISHSPIHGGFAAWVACFSTAYFPYIEVRTDWVQRTIALGTPFRKVLFSRAELW